MRSPPPGRHPRTLSRAAGAPSASAVTPRPRVPHVSAGSELLVRLMGSGLHRPCQSTGALSPAPAAALGWGWGGRWDSVEPVPTEGIALQAAPGREPGFLSSPFCRRREDRARGRETEARGPVLASLREVTLLRGLLTSCASQLDNEETQRTFSHFSRWWRAVGLDWGRFAPGGRF